MWSSLIAFAPDGDFGNGVFEGLIGGHEGLGSGWRVLRSCSENGVGARGSHQRFLWVGNVQTNLSLLSIRVWNYIYNRMDWVGLIYSFMINNDHPQFYS